MTRPCRTPRCTRQAAVGRARCGRCRYRIDRWGDPHHDPRAVDPMTLTIAATTRDPVPGITPAERRATALHLDGLGLSSAEIARITGVHRRTVHRWRAAQRAAA